MHIARAYLKSMSPISFSAPLDDTKKKPKESAADFDDRVWRDRMHTHPQTGNVIITNMMLKNSLADTAKYLSMPIKGKGKSTYTKHFDAGVQVNNHIDLGIKPENVTPQRLYLPSDGRRGGTTRVWRTFPLISHWEGWAEYIIKDDTITEEVFHTHLQQDGLFIGLGRWRPRNNGQYGTFRVEKFEWIDLPVEDFIKSQMAA